MGSPAIFSGLFTKLISSRGILKSDGSLLENDGIKNYIKNGHSEKGTTGWTNFVDAAASRPIDGLGGVPTGGLLWSTQQSGTLRGSSSFLFAKDAVNRQGEGVAYDFTIDTADKAKILQVSLDYIVASGTFVAGTSSADSDAIIYLYDITNSRLIEPSTFKFFSGSSTAPDRLIANFQTSVDSSNYRLIFYCASTSAAAYTLRIANIKVSPTTIAYGTSITDWSSYNPTFTGFGTVASIECQYRRVGDSVEIKGKFTSGVSTAVEARMTLPSGLSSADTGKIPSLQLAGKANYSAVAATDFSGRTVLIEPSVGYVTFGAETSTNGGISKANGSALISNGQVMSFLASVPVAGWSATGQMSDVSDQRIVGLRYTSTAGTSIPHATATQISFATKDYDTHAAWNGSQFTAPIAGIYEFAVGGSLTNLAAGGVHLSCELRVNGTGVSASELFGWCQTATEASTGVHTDKLKLNAGDVVTVWFFQSNGVARSMNTTAANNFVSINRISNPALISATETISSFRYKSSNSAALAAATDTVVSFDTSADDTHGAWTASDTWTAPSAGRYNICGALYYLAGLSTTNVITKIYKNAAEYQTVSVAMASNGTASGTPFSVDYKLNAGETIKIYARVNAGTATVVQGSVTGKESYCCIKRIGL